MVTDYDLDDAMARFNGLPYQLLVVDDPIGATSSRQSMKNSDLMARYYRIRHIYRQMSGNDTGCIALVWATQHLKGLDVFARDIDWTVWKAWPTEEAAAKMLKDNLPPSAVRRLRDITRRALAQRDNETRSEAVVHLTVTNRVGTVKLPMSEGWHLPFPEDREPVADAEEFSLTITKVLRALGKDPKWKGKVAIYSDVMQGMTRMEAAKKHSLRSQSSVAEAITSLRGEMCRRHGAEYEAFLAKRLKAQYPHCDVIHYGGQPQPDVIMEDPRTGEQRVYSAKCLDFTRTVYIGASDLHPELKEARKRGCKAFLAVYNISEGANPETIIDPLRPPERLSFTPIS